MVSDMWKDFLAFLFRITHQIKATQSLEIRITEEVTPIFRNVGNYSPKRQRKFKLAAIRLYLTQISHEDLR
jgi:hypothetical protein